MIAPKSNARSEPRVAWLLPDMGTGGLSFQHIISEFAKRFPKTSVYTGQWPGYAAGFEDDFSVQEVGATRYIELSRSKKGYAVGFSYASPRIISELFKFRPNVIFTNAFSIWTLFALGLKFIGRWKVVVTYEGGSSLYENPRSRIRHCARWLMARLADAFVANSRTGENYLKTTLGIHPDRIFSRPFLVSSKKALLQESAAEVSENTQLANTQLEAAQFKAQHQAGLLFLCVGQIIPRKGVKVLLDACKILNQQGYRNIALMIVGDGDQRPELKSFCAEQGLADQVKWVEAVPYHRLGKFFQLADVFVFPTFDDIWGMVLTEAMMFGKPVICSNKAGAVEMVEEHSNGFSYHPSDVAKLADRMRQFLEVPELATRMGEQSARIMAQHSPEQAVQAFIEAADLSDGLLVSNQEVTCASQL